MRGDQVNVGDLVTYRGEPRRVVRCWRPGAGEPAGGFDDPVGVEIEIEVNTERWTETTTKAVPVTVKDAKTGEETEITVLKTVAVEKSRDVPMIVRLVWPVRDADRTVEEKIAALEDSLERWPIEAL